MSKKMLAIIICFILTVGCMPSMAAMSDIEPDAPYIEAVEVITALGIMEPVNATEFRPKETVTRAEFVAYAIHLMSIDTGEAETGFYDVASNHPYAKEIAMAYRIGMVHGDGCGYFNPDASVSLSDAVKILCFVTGHNVIAKQYDNPEAKYMKLAHELGLVDGLSLNDSDKLTRGETALILYNALFTPVVQANYSSNSSILYVDSTQTVMTQYLNIHYAEGRVTANSYTSITGQKDSKETEIEVEFVKYTVKEQVYDELLGYHVNVFYREDKSKRRELLHIMANEENKEVTIDAGDILSVADDKVVYDDGVRIKTVKIPKDIYVTYNGDMCFDWTLSDLNISKGTLKILSNDGDNQADFVIVETYTNDLVVNVSETLDKIYLKNAKPIEYLSVDKTVIVKDAVSGKLVSVKDIPADSLISIATSKDGNIITLYTNNTLVKGIVTSISDDKAEISNVSYPVDCALDLSSYIGETVEVWKDFKGNLVMMKDQANSDLLGYIIAVGVEGSAFNKKAVIKLATENGTVEVFDVVEKVSVDGKRTVNINGQQKDITNENLKFVLENAAKNAGTKDGHASQLIRYSTNSDGEIKEIDTAYYDSTTEKENSLQLSKLITKESGESIYCRQGGVLYNTSTKRTICNVPTDAKVFKVSNAPDYRDEENAITIDNGKLFVADRYYVNGSTAQEVAFEAYNVNDVNTTDIVVLYIPDDSILDDAGNNISSNWRERAFPIMGIRNSLNSNLEEVVSFVTLNQSGREVIYQTTEKLAKTGVSEKFKVGDVIAVEMINNKITSIKKLFEYTSDAEYMVPALTAQDAVFYGNLYSCDGNYMALDFDMDTDVDDISSFYLGHRDTRFMIYNVEDQKLSLAEVGDFIGRKETGGSGNNVLIYTNWGTPQFVLMYE